MKKILALVLLFFIVLSLSACKENATENNLPKNGTVEQNSSKVIEGEIQTENDESDIKLQKSTNKVWSVDSVRRNAMGDIFLSEQDAVTLENLLSFDNWIPDLTNCAADVTLKCDDDRQISYHSECGTFNDLSNQKSLHLDDGEKGSFNELISQYVELGF